MSNKSVAKGSEWTAYNGTKVLVLDVRTLDGVEYVTYQRNAWSGKSVQTRTRGDFVGLYQEKETFFTVGGTYKCSWSQDTYHIQSVHDISKPTAPENRKAAVAVCITASDKRQLVTLSLSAFGEMTKVK